MTTNINMVKCWLKKTLWYSTCDTIYSYCWSVHCGFISNGTVVGLSKMNRIVDTMQKPSSSRAFEYSNCSRIQKVLGTEDVFV